MELISVTNKINKLCPTHLQSDYEIKDIDKNNMEELKWPQVIGEKHWNNLEIKQLLETNISNIISLR